MKSKINNINSNDRIFKGFIMISEELLVIPEKNKIAIINIKEYNLIKIIDVSNSNSVIGIRMLNDNILFTRDSNVIIKQLKLKEII